MIHIQDAFSLRGMHVVVVGASSGIGRRVAMRCAEAGARISACARREELLADLVREMGKGHGHRVLDVRDPAAIESVFGEFAQARGPIGGLVYAAGYVRLVPLNVVSPDHWDDVFATNLRGAALCLRAATSAQRMSPDGMAAILISSTGADKPGGGAMTAYTASKGGLESLAVAASVELGKRNVRVNAIAPCITAGAMVDGLTATADFIVKTTDNIPLGRCATADDSAFACVYLLSPAAAFISGMTLFIDGGLRGA